MANEIQPPQNAQPTEALTPTAAPQASGPVNVINPEGQLVSIDQGSLQDALDLGYQTAQPEQVAQYAKEQKYGTAGQQLKTVAEGLAQGVAGPLATGLETKLGIATPEDIRSREEVNPGLHIASEVAGFAGPALVSGGASVAAKLGMKGAAEALPLAAKIAEHTQAGVISRIAEASVPGFVKNEVGKDAIKGAFEAALYQGGEELSRKFKEDPAQTAEMAASDIGLAGIMGGVFGGAIGAALKRPGPRAVEPIGQFVSQVDAAAIEAGDFAATIRHADNLDDVTKKSILSNLKQEKANAPELKWIMKENGLPALEGILSKHEMVQKAEDSLLHGAPTFSAIRRQKLYNEAYDKSVGIIDGALGPGSTETKASLGNNLKDSIVANLKEENAPIKAMYAELKKVQDVIPIPKNSAEETLAKLQDLPQLRISKKLPAGRMVADVAEGLENLKTVDDIIVLKSMVGVSPLAGTPEKYVAGVLKDILTEFEESAIEVAAKDYAKNFSEVMGPEVRAAFNDLRAARKQASDEYKGFITKVQELSHQLGKGRVYGVQDAINFIQDLTPEQVTNRLFSKNNSEFLKFFSKEFPDQMKLMQDYQKGVLRENATKDGVFSPKRLFTSINKLEPEIQKALFSAHDLKKLGQMQEYLENFPKNFSPSGTSGMSAMREFFTHPMGAASGNARDLAIEGFIKAAGSSPDALAAGELAKATIAGDKLATKSVKALFAAGKEGIPAALIPLSSHRAKLLKQIETYKKEPDKMVAMNDNNPLPEYSTAFSATTMRALDYLTSIQPDRDPKAPLDSTLPPNPFKQAAYERALDIAQSPLFVVQKMKTGTLVPQDVITLKTIYPGVYANLNSKMMEQIVDANAKSRIIPYQTRMQMSMFMGQPLDSTLTPLSIQQAQLSRNQRQQEQPGQALQAGNGGAKHSTSGLKKLADSSATPSQNRQADRAKY